MYPPGDKLPTISVISLSSGPKVSGPKTPNGKSDGKSGISLKSALPQLLAGLSAQMFNIAVGVSMAYSSSLIPQLEAKGSKIPVTREQSALLASIMVLTVPVGALSCGYLLDAVGRLNSIKLVIIPMSLSWIIIATANSFAQILAGRLLMGATFGVGCNTALLYIAEVADRRLRGGLSCLGTTLASLGIVIGYVGGALLDWRTAAWASSAVPLFPLALMFTFGMESPVWLRSKGKIAAAQKSSMYFYGDPDFVVSAPSSANTADTNGSNKTALLPFFTRLRLLFTKPSGYKPLLILNLMFLIQQLMGIYITIYFAVTFFQEAGSTLDNYIATILIGVVRFVMCLCTAFLLGRFSRRKLMMFSSVGMAICMGTSAYATSHILNKEPFPSSVVVGGVLAYVAMGCLGFQTIPWTMMSELFPHDVRELAQSVTMAMAHVFMFSVLQLYPTLDYCLGGSTGVQILFAGVCLGAAVVVWVLLPETCGKALWEIEEYFKHNAIFLGQKRKEKKLQVKQQAEGSTP